MLRWIIHHGDDVEACCEKVRGFFMLCFIVFMLFVIFVCRLLF